MIRRKAIVYAWSWPVASLAISAAAGAAETFPFDIAPGRFDEHCLRVEAGHAIRYRFEASAAVDFNIHHHRGREVFYPVKRDGVEREQGEFRAAVSDEYCLMWTNRGPTTVRVRGDVAR